MSERNSQHKPKRTERRVFIVLLVVFMVNVIAFAIFRMIVSGRAQEQLDAIRAAGYPVTLDEFAEWQQKPLLGENAADVFQDAFGHYVSYGKGLNRKASDDDWADGWQRERNLPPVDGHWASRRTMSLPDAPISTKMKEDIKWYLALNAEALNLLHQAAAMEYCRYPINFEVGYLQLEPLEHGASLLTLQAALSVEENEAGQASKALTSLLCLARSLQNDRMARPHMSQIEFRNQACATLEFVLTQMSLPDSELAGLITSFTTAENPEELKSVQIGSRCRLITCFLDSALTLPYESKAGKVFRRVSGLKSMDFHAGLKLSTKLVEASKLPYPEHLQEAAQIEKEYRNISGYCRLTRILLHTPSGIVLSDAGSIARLRCAVTALAIERYRRANNALPESLDELAPKYLEKIPADPFDGQALRYETREKGYIVYSIGENKIDDGGNDIPENRTGRTYDIVFHVER